MVLYILISIQVCCFHFHMLGHNFFDSLLLLFYSLTRFFNDVYCNFFYFVYYLIKKIKKLFQIKKKIDFFT